MTKRQAWKLRRFKQKYHRTFMGFFDLLGILLVSLGSTMILAGAFLLMLSEPSCVAVFFVGFSSIVIGIESFKYGRGEKHGQKNIGSKRRR
jgi:hypothetical protein